MSKGFNTFADVPSDATGLVPNSLYHIGGRDEAGDALSGLFVYLPGIQHALDNDHVPVGTSGTLVRQTADLIHEIRHVFTAVDALSTKVPIPGVQPTASSLSIVPAATAVFPLPADTAVALTSAERTALSSAVAAAIDTALRATPLSTTGGGSIDNSALAAAIDTALRASPLAVTGAGGTSIDNGALATAIASAVDTAMRASPLAVTGSGGATIDNEALAVAIAEAIELTTLSVQGAVTLPPDTVQAVAGAIDTALRDTPLSVTTDDVPGHTTILNPTVTGTWAPLANTTGRSVTVANGRYTAAGPVEDGIIVEVRRVGTTASIVLPVGELTTINVDANANEIELRRYDQVATPVTLIVGVSPFVQKGDAGVTLVNTAAAADIGTAVNTLLRASALSVSIASGAEVGISSSSNTALSNAIGTAVNTAIRATSLPTTATVDAGSVTALSTAIATAVDTALRATDLKVSDNAAGNTMLANAAVTGTWTALASNVGRTVTLGNARYDNNGIVNDNIVIEVRRVGTTSAAVVPSGEYLALTVNANANELEVRRRDGNATAVDVPIAISPFILKGDGSVSLVNTANATDIGAAVNTALRATALPTSATVAAGSVTALSAAVATAVDTALRATPIIVTLAPPAPSEIVAVTVTNTAAAVPSKACKRFALLNERYTAAGIPADEIPIQWRRGASGPFKVLPAGKSDDINVNANANEIQVQRADGTAGDVAAQIQVLA